MPKRQPIATAIPQLTLDFVSSVHASTALFTRKVKGYDTREEYVKSVLTWARMFVREVEALQKGNN